MLEIKEVLDALGLSIYHSEILALLEQKETVGTAQTKIDELKKTELKNINDALDKLNGDENTQDSVRALIKAVKAELETKIKLATYDDSTIKADVKANTTAIATLNGNAQTEGSVSKQVADAVAKIVAEAPEAYDTLQEIATWISTHEGSASAMNQSIQTNKTDIANLVKLVGSLPEGSESKTIVKYIDSKVAGVDFTGAIATAKQEAISAAATDAKTKADTAETNAKNAVKELAGGQVKTNTDNIEALRGRVESLESVTIVSISADKIRALFEQ
ncbi:hypothetical protein [uncultured Eubacterium sp.]|uniref:hypothetical protein n=1 Tax=uncultured Eubacterium sp. TaxID=165185 RepID=UPI0026757E80|nr:hypothetical protein [uncultured Eubacterium sp.]